MILHYLSGDSEVVVICQMILQCLVIVTLHSLAGYSEFAVLVHTDLVWPGFIYALLPGNGNSDVNSPVIFLKFNILISPDLSYDVLDDNEDLLHQLSAQLGLPSFLDEDHYSMRNSRTQLTDKLLPPMEMLATDTVMDISMAEDNVPAYPGKTQGHSLAC